ncbi:tRNA (adenosine(37)-N6)-threonylcarbamoyltransferase complex dimerization subunit type 1 TsaB [bacterium]|nr:tRNA (adenosine(37)-N6)-threonylcarbamoyltransferase complex dimerization subunit type 1 TsaB [bacterium]
MILGIDTAAQTLGVALAETGSIVARKSIDIPNAHDAMLAPVIQELLKENGLQAADLSTVAVASGPGSFTGLRIGMAMAKGFAFSLAIPLIAVPTMDAIAFAVRRQRNVEHDSQLLVALDARRERVYHAAYRSEGDAWTRISGPALSAIDDLKAPHAAPLLLAGDAAQTLAERFSRGTVLSVACATAEDIVLLGTEMLAAGQSADPETCEPLYLQDFIVKQAKNPLFTATEKE